MKKEKEADTSVDLNKQELAKWRDRMSIAEKNQESSFSKFSQWFDDLYGVLNSSDYADWRSKVYFPKLTAKLWSILPKLALDKPGARVISKGQEPNIDGARLVEDLLDYQYENPEFDEPMFKKLTDTLIDAMVTGKGIALVPWTAKRKTVIEQLTEPIKDEEGNVIDEQLVLGKKRVISFLNSYPDFIPVNIFNFFYAPSGNTLQSKPWLIIKDFKTIYELKEEGTYENTDKLKELRAKTDKFAQYNYSRNKLVSEQDKTSADSTVSLVEVWQCFDKETNTITTIAGGEVILKKMHNPYWHGKFPIVDFEIKPRSHDFWGEGIFEVNRQLQIAMNDIVNHYIDNLNLSLDGMVKHDASVTIYEYTVQPGGEFIADGQVDQWKFPTPDPGQLKVIDEYLTRCLDENTILPYAAGVPNSPTDKTAGTATGIQALQRAADDLLGFMKNCYKTSLRQVLTFWMQMDQQFIDRTLYIDMVEEGKRIPKEMNPARIQGQFELKVEDELDRPADPEMEKGQFLAMVDQLLKIKQAADAQELALQRRLPVGLVINYDNVAKEILEKFGKSEADKILEEKPSTPPTGVPMGQETGEIPAEMPQDGQMPPEMMQEPQMEQMPPQAPEMPQMGLMDKLKGMFKR